jgi:uncharacterized RmlC-like cupin family protein
MTMLDKELKPDSPATCAVVRAGASFIGKQGLAYAPGISAEAVGSKGIHVRILTIPPGGRAKAHKREGRETAL